MSGSYQQFLEDHWNKLTGAEGQGAGGSAKHNLRPLYVIDKENPDALLAWLEGTLEILEEEQIHRASNQVNNVNFYNGLQRYMSGNYQDSKVFRANGTTLGKDAFFVMNHARDFVNQSVARLSRYSPNINVLPVNNEYGDRIGARNGKRVIDNIFGVNDFESIVGQVLLEGKLCGEGFVVVKYNKSMGDKSKLALEAEAEGIRSFTNSLGEELSLDVVKRTGEVEIQHVLPWFVLHEPAFKWRDVNYCFVATIKHIDQIRAENRGMDLGGLATIQMNANGHGGYGPGFKYGEWVLEYEFYHRGVGLLDEGFYAKFARGVLLESGKLPYSHRGLPVARWTDFDTLLDCHGVSFLEDLKPPLVMMNKMLGLMYRNVAIANHPKIMVPEGSANIHSMANGPLVVEYTWPMKPEIMTFQGNASDVFQVSDKIMQQATQLSGTFDSSRGGVVPNARAGSILNFYEEQEEQRESMQIKKLSAFIKKVGTMALGTAADFYEPDDGRTLRVVGERNYYKMRELKDTKKLSGPYDVKVERTTALSESKQGRIDQIVALGQVPVSTSPMDQAKPGIFTREQILRMLEVADTPTFFEMATAAVEKQESENEDMFEGIAVNPPERWEAHAVAWNVLFQFMQSREFTDTKGLPENVKQMFLDHMLVHEVFMYEKAEKNLTFAQELMLNSNYPCVLDLGTRPTINQIVMMLQMPPQPPMPVAPPGMMPPEGAGAPAGMGDEAMDAMPEAESEVAEPMQSQAPAPNLAPDTTPIQ